MQAIIHATKKRILQHAGAPLRMQWFCSLAQCLTIVLKALEPLLKQVATVLVCALSYMSTIYNSSEKWTHCGM